MRPIERIIIHCADTPTGTNFTVADIDKWHKDRGFQRQEAYRLAFNPTLKSIGYHFVIYLDGSIHTGRQIGEVGAHCAGLNSTSIGICMIGKGIYTPEQWASLRELVNNLKNSYPGVKIIGHSQTPTGSAQSKTCPNFDVSAWVAQNYKPNSIHVT